MISSGCWRSSSASCSGLSFGTHPVCLFLRLLSKHHFLYASPNFHAHTGTRLKRRPHVRANYTTGECQIVFLQNPGEDYFRFDLRERRADAVSRATAEGQEGVGRRLLCMSWREAIGIKYRRVTPIAWISV